MIITTKAQAVERMESVNTRLKALEALYELACKSGGSLAKREALEARIDKLNERFCDLMLLSEKLV